MTDKTLQKIMPGARVMRDLRTPAVSAPRIAINQALRDNAAAENELRYALGDINYNECAVYDYRNARCLTDLYYGQVVRCDETGHENAIDFKQWFDERFRLDDLALKYGVFKQVSLANYPGWGKWTNGIREIRANPNGGFIVCNFVVADLADNSVKLLSDSWGGAAVFKSAINASQNIVLGGLQCAGNGNICGKLFRHAIREEYRRQVMLGR